MLNDTSTSSGALGAQSGRNSDGERELVCRDSIGVVAEVTVRDEWGSNDRVCSGVDDGNIGNSSVWCADIELEWNNLSSGVALNIGGVILELESFAEPDVASLSVVVCLTAGNLEFSLDVSVVVRELVVVNLSSTSGSLNSSQNQVYHFKA